MCVCVRAYVRARPHKPFTDLPSPHNFIITIHPSGTSTSRSARTTPTPTPTPAPPIIVADANAPHAASATLASTTPTTFSRQLQRFRRATVHSAVLAAWFFLAYAPFGFYYLWLLLSGVDRKEEAKTSRITVLSSFPLANSLVDPLLIIWRLFDFQALCEWFRRDLTEASTRFISVFRRRVRRSAALCWRTTTQSCCRKIRRRWRGRRRMKLYWGRRNKVGDAHQPE